MGKYSNMVREAQRTAVGDPFGMRGGGGGGGAAGAKREFEKVKTSGLDPSSKEAQDRAMAYFENVLQNIDVDLSAKYERASERRRGSERSAVGARGYGLNSPIAAALEERGQGELQAQRAGEEFGLGTQRMGVGSQGLLGSIGLGRETYGYNPTTWSPQQSGQTGSSAGGGGAFYWPDANRPTYSPEINEAYERNRGRGFTGQGSAAAGGGAGYNPDIGAGAGLPGRQANSNTLSYYEQRARKQ